MLQSATLTDKPSARRRACRRAPRLLGLALLLLAVVLALPAGAGASVAPPMISGFTPTSGPVGTAVTLTGVGFTGATVVELVHARAVFTVVSATRIDLTVPAGAISGRIGVTTLSGMDISADDFTVTPLIAVTAPTGTGSYAAGDSLTVGWTTSNVAADGEFDLWVRSPAGGWYAAKLVPAGAGGSLTTTLTLAVPGGSGYQAIVAWRPTAGSGDWVSWGTSPGSFTVTSTAPAITVTAPWGSGGGYSVGSLLTVSWTTGRATATGQFGVWARSAAGVYYAAKLWPADGGTSFNTFLVLTVPPGNGYQAIVAWRPTAGLGAWISWGTSPGSFDVTAAPPVTTYTITTSADEGLSITLAAGIIDRSGGLNFLPSGVVTVNAGATPTFNITYTNGNSGRRNGGAWTVKVDDVAVGGNSPNTYTFQPVYRDYTISATWGYDEG